MFSVPETFELTSWRGAARRVSHVAAAVLLAAGAAQAQDMQVRQVSPHLGEMFATLQAPESRPEIVDTLRFEPFELIDEMFTRSDVVWVMRHGPTDWSKLDVKDVSPADCVNQRVMSDQGRIDMVNLGILMAENDILPSRIIVSEWCRNQQTVQTLLEGVGIVDPLYPDQVPIETDPDLNLLLALQGAPSVGSMREIVSSWTGEGAEGPLLLITHFTNIEELFDFSVYEGEILVVDPKRNNRVLGYIRLKSAGPDVGHFGLD